MSIKLGELLVVTLSNEQQRLQRSHVMSSSGCRDNQQGLQSHEPGELWNSENEQERLQSVEPRWAVMQ